MDSVNIQIGNLTADPTVKESWHSFVGQLTNDEVAELANVASLVEMLSEKELQRRRIETYE